MRKGICGICKKERMLKLSNKLNLMICDGCRKEDCFLCNRFKPVAARSANGQPICNTCFQRARYHNPTRHETCIGCKKMKPVAARTESDGPLCASCNNKSKIGICQKCEKEKIIKAGGLCGACHEKKRRTKAILRHNKKPCAIS